MRHVIISLAAVAALVVSSAELAAQAAPRFAPSGRGTSEIVLMRPEGTPDSTPAPRVRVDYGQPHLRGRALHTDSLVPFDQVWRAGANGTTIFETDLDLRVGGTAVPKGRYALFTIPGKSEWTLILQRDIGQTIADYDAKHDVARLAMKRRELHTPVESLSMWLVPASAGLRGELRIVWGTDEVSVPFEAAGP